MRNHSNLIPSASAFQAASWPIVKNASETHGLTDGLSASQTPQIWLVARSRGILAGCLLFGACVIHNWTLSVLRLETRCRDARCEQL